jgi:hypothetical protein
MDDLDSALGPPALPPLRALEGYEPPPRHDSAPPVGLRRSTVLVAVGCALSSGIALVVAIVSHTNLAMACTFIVVPAFIAFVAMTVMVRRDEQALFFHRLRAGLLAGALGTAAYDGLRFAVESAGLSSAGTFRAIKVFGWGLTGQELDSAPALVAGWSFHVLNGVGFALAYVMVMAGRRLYWAVLYAMVLEVAMVTLYPGWLDMTPSSEFLTLSVLGHVGYGLAVGAVSERAR